MPEILFCGILLLITGCAAETQPTPDVQATVDVAVQRALSTQAAATASSAETAAATPTPATIIPAPPTQIPEPTSPPTSPVTTESTVAPNPGYSLAINGTLVQPGQGLVEIPNGTVHLVQSDYSKLTR